MLQQLINPCHHIQNAIDKFCLEDPNSKLCKAMHKKYVQCVDRYLQLGTISKMGRQSQTTPVNSMTW
jgi:hypothetical protein